MNPLFRRIHRKSRPIDEATRPLELDVALHAVLDGERSRDDAGVQRVLSRDGAQADRFAEVSAAIASLEQPIRTPDLSKSILDAVEARRPFAMGPVELDDESAPARARRGRRRLSGARFAIIGGALALVTVVVLLDRIPAPAGNALRNVARPVTPMVPGPGVARPIAAAVPGVSSPSEVAPARRNIAPPERAYTALTLGTQTSRYEVDAPFLPGPPFTLRADRTLPPGEFPRAFVWEGRATPPIADPFPLAPALPGTRATPTQAGAFDELLTPNSEFWWRELWGGTAHKP